MQNFDILSLENFFLLCVLRGVLKQGINSFVSFVLTIIDLKVVIREFWSLTDLLGAQTLCVHESANIVMVGEYKYLLLRLF